ncbi:MAG: head decoration protein [Chromatiales bacterium]|nr:head decoration protein [Chromatiales bacterium]
MTTFTEGRHAGEFIVAEANGTRSREVGTLALGQDLEAGTVLGRITKGVAAAEAVTGNTGNATITAAPTVGAGAKPGVYRLTALSATRVMVQDPDGIALPNAIVGTEYDTHLTFTITAGGTALAIGDSFTITVAAGSGHWTQFDPDGVDGSGDGVRRPVRQHRRRRRRADRGRPGARCRNQRRRADLARRHRDG